MNLKIIQIDDHAKATLKAKVLALGETTLIAHNPKLFANLIALGLHQEIGTIHDELATFAFDGKSGLKLPEKSLQSEIVQFRDFVGVRIWSQHSNYLDFRVPGIRDHFHPDFSERSGHYFKSVVTFPEISMKIADLESFQLVFVKPWALNTIFGGFDPYKPYYEANMWEFIHLDSLRYAKLLEKRQIVYLGTHDLVSHIAGVQKYIAPKLQDASMAVKTSLERYFSIPLSKNQPLRPAALVIPHVTGLILDDLAQPMNYQSKSRWTALNILLRYIDSRMIDPDSQKYLLKYPEGVKKFIEVARKSFNQHTEEYLKISLDRVVSEIKHASLEIP